MDKPPCPVCVGTCVGPEIHEALGLKPGDTLVEIYRSEKPRNLIIFNDDTTERSDVETFLRTVFPYLTDREIWLVIQQTEIIGSAFAGSVADPAQIARLETATPAPRWELR